MRTTPIFTIIILLFTLSACGSFVGKRPKADESKSKPETKVQLITNVSPTYNETFILGSVIEIGYNTLTDIDSVRIMINGEKIDENQYKSNRVGQIRYRVTAYKDESSQAFNGQFTVISNIEPKIKQARIVRTYPHSTEAYTQGLLFHDGKLYESTGERGSSSVREIELTTGKVLRQRDLDKIYFGEGLTLFGDKLYQLTWEEGVAFVYDIDNFENRKELSLPIEGWGITNDGENFYITDGSSKIYKYCGKRFCKLSEIEVADNYHLVEYINELEWVNGKIWANIYTTEVIAVIDPHTGIIEEYLDCRALIQHMGNAVSADVFNGIAYDKRTGRIWVTGKKWDTLFEVAF